MSVQALDQIDLISLHTDGYAVLTIADHFASSTSRIPERKFKELKNAQNTLNTQNNINNVYTNTLSSGREAVSKTVGGKIAKETQSSSSSPQPYFMPPSNYLPSDNTSSKRPVGVF